MNPENARKWSEFSRTSIAALLGGLITLFTYGKAAGANELRLDLVETTAKTLAAKVTEEHDKVLVMAKDLETAVTRLAAIQKLLEDERADRARSIPR